MSFSPVIRCKPYPITNTVTFSRNPGFLQSQDCALALSSVTDSLCPYIANFEDINVQSVTQSSVESERGESIQVENGAPGEIRTRDLLITSQPL